MFTKLSFTVTSIFYMLHRISSLFQVVIFFFFLRTSLATVGHMKGSDSISTKTCFSHQQVFLGCIWLTFCLLPMKVYLEPICLYHHELLTNAKRKIKLIGSEISSGASKSILLSVRYMILLLLGISYFWRVSTWNRQSCILYFLYIQSDIPMLFAWV